MVRFAWEQSMTVCLLSITPAREMAVQRSESTPNRNVCNCGMLPDIINLAVDRNPSPLNAQNQTRSKRITE
jgi:hypothetical protein